jgi:hypothetical protein
VLRRGQLLLQFQKRETVQQGFVAAVAVAAVSHAPSLHLRVRMAFMLVHHVAENRFPFRPACQLEEYLCAVCVGGSMRAPNITGSSTCVQCVGGSMRASLTGRVPVCWVCWEHTPGSTRTIIAGNYAHTGRLSRKKCTHCFPHTVCAVAPPSP